MAMIVQSIAEKICVVEFHSTHPKLFSCGNTINLEMVFLVNELKSLLRFSRLNNRTTDYKDPPY